MLSSAIRYVGVDDRAIDLFEGQYRVPDGISYNSYVILDQDVAVMDTVDAAFTDEWLAHVRTALAGRVPTYLVIHHMEPDHSSCIAEFLRAYPEATVVTTAKAVTMIGQFFPSLDLGARVRAVRNGETLSLGAHTLQFILAPMVHWPEVMVTYERQEQVLFSADAFGRFGASDVEMAWDGEARRYYFGIVGKYGAQVQALLRALEGQEFRTICPLHGPALSEGLDEYLELYRAWSAYTPEEEGVVIAYASIYGHTRSAAEYLTARVREQGGTAVLYDLARCDWSQAVADAFRYTKLVLASASYNADVFPPMRHFIQYLTERNYQGRSVALIENGSWAPTAGKVMRALLEEAKNIAWLSPSVRILSNLKPTDYAALDELADALV